MARKIVIEFKPKSELRVPDSFDDWYIDEEGNHRIVIAEMKSRESEILLAIHALVESELCYQHGVASEQVDAWDASCPDEEPGDNPEAPYFEEHKAAMNIERAAANHFGLDWDKHEEGLDDEEART